MEFRTVVKPLEGMTGLISHRSPVVMTGSCFTDNIGARLRGELYDCIVNPCGTLYNPASIAASMLDLLYEREFTADELFLHEGVWKSYSHHSRFSGSDRDGVLKMMNDAASEAREALKSASALIVTFGTAWIFRLKEGNRVVANCHKQPASLFNREMLNATQIIGLWKKILREIAARYPDLKVIFTVSPIRHLADGAHGNQVSKSTLLLAVDRLVAENPDMALYFPSYEIMLDDLRDYRFYASDMVHPSDVAVDYIYDLFRQSFIDESDRSLGTECGRLVRRLNHRSLSGLHDEAFTAATAEMRDSLLARHPYLSRAMARL